MEGVSLDIDESLLVMRQVAVDVEQPPFREQ